MKLTIRIDEMVRRYLGGESSEQIAEGSGVSSRQIRNILASNGVEMRSTRRQPIYEINVDFFKTWSAEMAYVLGFILTDGCVSGNSFYIAQKEPEILERIGSVMKSNYPIRKNPNGKSYLHTLTVSRKEMVEDLAALGIGEKKSLTVGFPKVPAQYVAHFIRGVIDGDGWVQDRGYVANVTSGSKEFADGLCEVLRINGFNTDIQNQSGAWRIWVRGKDDIRRLAEWLYADAGVLFLERKRARMAQRNGEEVNA
jgi:DNA-binding transcriptional regulator WhiA